MDAKFWHNRWQDNLIPFHKAQVNDYLERYFERLGLAHGDRVLVPLCGKSVDMAWLRDRGCAVTGVELSAIAVRDFFSEQGIAASESEDGDFLVLEGGGITLLSGDFFALGREHTAKVSAVYDRAALIALPEEMRARYVDQLLSLVAPEVPMLLLTFEYPAHEITVHHFQWMKNRCGRYTRVGAKLPGLRPSTGSPRRQGSPNAA